MTTKTRPAVWMGLGGVLGALMTSTWLHAQSDEARAKALEDALRAQAQAGGSGAERVYSGPDVGFRAQRGERGATVFVPVVRVDGKWLEVQLGAPGVRFLSK